jgi:hypothetical protein
MSQRVSYCIRAGGGAFFLTVLLWLALMIPGRVVAERAPTADSQKALQAAVNWLIGTHQNDDGGFTSFSTGANLADSDVGGTADALLALAVVDADLALPLAYLESAPEAVAAYVGQNGGTAGKLILAVTLSGADPRDFGGHNLVLSTTAHLSPSGQFGVNTPFEQALAIAGLAAAGEAVPLTATTWLLERQAVDGDLAGSWDDGYGTPGNADATGMAILALLGSGQDVAQPIRAAIDFLARAQLPSGGWEYGPGLGESANSTALALHALLVTGQDVFSAGGPWQPVGGVNPVEALLAWQSESGAFQADFGQGRFDDFFATVQSLPALSAAVDLAPLPPAETVTAAPPPTMVPTDVPDEPAPTSVLTIAPEPEATAVPVPTVTAESTPADTPEAAGANVPWLLVIGVIALVVAVGGGLWYWHGRS